MLQEKIDHLERLLAENNEIISNIRDSVINLSESVEDGTKNSKGNFSHGAGSPLLPSKHLSLTVDPGDCLFASQSGSQSSDVQVMYAFINYQRALICFSLFRFDLVPVYSCSTLWITVSVFVKSFNWSHDH